MYSYEWADHAKSLVDHDDAVEIVVNAKCQKKKRFATGNGNFLSLDVKTELKKL